MQIKRNIIILLVALTIALSGVIVEAQIITDLTLGLKRPAKVILTEQGNLIVAEEGTLPRRTTFHYCPANGRAPHIA